MNKRKKHLTTIGAGSKHALACLGFIWFGASVVWPVVRQSPWLRALRSQARAWAERVARMRQRRAMSEDET